MRAAPALLVCLTGILGVCWAMAPGLRTQSVVGAEGVPPPSPTPYPVLGDWEAVIALVRQPDGRLVGFQRGSTDNELWQRVEAEPDSHAWSEWVSLGSGLDSDPAAAVNADGRIQVFVRMNNSLLFTKWQEAPNSNTWSDWHMIFSFPTSNPQVTYLPDKRFQVWIRGLDLGMWYITQIAPSNSTTFEDWVSVRGFFHKDENPSHALRGEPGSRLGPLETNFGLWAMSNQRRYATVDEYHYRLGVYKSNLGFIEKHNREAAEGKHTYTVGVNRFADMTMEEVRKIFMGTPQTVHIEAASRSRVSKEHLKKLPVSMDWRGRAVAEVKDQGMCGSCWSFAAVAGLEGAYAIKSGHVRSFSEQQMCDCSRSYGNGGCMGGEMFLGYQYVIDASGIEAEAAYPYLGKDVATCGFNASAVVAKFSRYVNITRGDEGALQEAIAHVGPCSAGMNAEHPSFVFYKSGVYFNPACNPQQMDHGVAVVGYGVTEGGLEYWIVKNSWSPDWGMDGFIWMARNVNNHCGIATTAAYPVV